MYRYAKHIAVVLKTTPPAVSTQALWYPYAIHWDGGIDIIDTIRKVDFTPSMPPFILLKMAARRIAPAGVGQPRNEWRELSASVENGRWRWKNAARSENSTLRASNDNGRGADTAPLFCRTPPRPRQTHEPSELRSGMFEPPF
jgi:hypothetical protein